MKIQMRIVNRALTFSEEDQTQTVRVKVFQMRTSEQEGMIGDVWTPWENIPEYDAEDVEAEDDAIASGNESKGVLELGL